MTLKKIVKYYWSGSGYIGPVMAEELLSAGYSIRCLDLLLYNNGLSFVPLIKNADLNLCVEIFQTNTYLINH